MAVDESPAASHYFDVMSAFFALINSFGFPSLAIQDRRRFNEAIIFAPNSLKFFVAGICFAGTVNYSHCPTHTERNQLMHLR